VRESCVARQHEACNQPHGGEADGQGTERKSPTTVDGEHCARWYADHLADRRYRRPTEHDAPSDIVGGCRVQERPHRWIDDRGSDVARRSGSG
jgi:hypothetical protein